MLKNKKGATLVELIVVSPLLLIIVIALLGYGLNIYHLTKCDFKEPYKAEIVRGIGLIPIVGAITGYIKIEDK